MCRDGQQLLWPRLSWRGREGEEGCTGGLGLREVRKARDRCLGCSQEVNPGTQPQLPGTPAW